MANQGEIGQANEANFGGSGGDEWRMASRSGRAGFRPYLLTGRWSGSGRWTEHRIEPRDEAREFLGYNAPNDIEIDVEVAVSQLVAHAEDLAPRDGRVERHEPDRI